MRTGCEADPSPASSVVVLKGEAILLPYGPYALYRNSVPVQGCSLPFLWCTVDLTTSEVKTLGRNKGSDCIRECLTKYWIMHAVIQAYLDKMTTGKSLLMLLYLGNTV